MRDNFGKILLATVCGTGIALWLSINFKAALLAMSLFCLLMWFNITLTTLGNAMIGRDVDVNYDIFWKILFIILASAGFGIYFNI
jgi:hypothetical protein